MFAPGVACITTTFVEMLDRLVEAAEEIEELHLQLYATTAAFEETLLPDGVGDLLPGGSVELSQLVIETPIA